MIISVNRKQKIETSGSSFFLFLIVLHVSPEDMIMRHDSNARVTAD